MAIRIARGTKAAFDALVAANSLVSGRQYLITDLGVVFVGTGTNTYIQNAALAGAYRFEVVTAYPGSPDANTIYLKT
jgi:hypothetical protein